MVKNNKIFVKKTFFNTKISKTFDFLVKNLKKKLSYFSRCFYMESPISENTKSSKILRSPKMYSLDGARLD